MYIYIYHNLEYLYEQPENSYIMIMIYDYIIIYLIFIICHNHLWKIIVIILPTYPKCSYDQLLDYDVYIYIYIHIYISIHIYIFFFSGYLHIYIHIYIYIYIYLVVGKPLDFRWIFLMAVWHGRLLDATRINVGMWSKPEKSLKNPSVGWGWTRPFLS